MKQSMQEKFLQTLESVRQKAADAGVRIRPIADMAGVCRCLDGHRESDGFWALADRNLLQYSLEALAVRKEFSPLFTDDQANTALCRLLDAGYSFHA